jgi:hypothetical protein
MDGYLGRVVILIGVHITRLGGACRKEGATSLCERCKAKTIHILPRAWRTSRIKALGAHAGQLPAFAASVEG